MSDDSHGISQIATNFARALAYMKSLNVEHIYYLEPPTEGASKMALDLTAVPVAEIEIR